MTAIKQNYGEKVFVQFEDFANHNAFDLLDKYGPTHLVFNDGIQGTSAVVVLSGLVAALKSLGGTLADHTFLFLGAGEAGTGIAELLALEMWHQMLVYLYNPVDVEQGQQIEGSVTLTPNQEDGPNVHIHIVYKSGDRSFLREAIMR